MFYNYQLNLTPEPLFTMLPTYSRLSQNEERAIAGALRGNANQAANNMVRLALYVDAFRAQINNLPSCVALNRDYVTSFDNAFQAAVAETCDFCGGRGHEQRECMSLIKWTRAARDCGFGFHFGALKGLAYYRARIAAMQPAQVAQVALQASAAASSARRSSRLRSRGKK